ncbi:MAG: hypothetical protein IKZ46_13940 [Victivallales bacterium]|nr:hypothetical protein [Victivallales bacterium]
MLKKLLLTSLICGLCFTSLMAQDADEKKEDKLLPLITMEQAFAKALQTRNVLAQYINKENAKLENATTSEKEEITKNVTAARQRLAEINTYMDVIYGLGGRRAYEYNRVTSEIYLRVGTVSEVFTRAIATRDALAKQITELKKAIEDETDADKKKNLEAAQTNAVNRYALVVNALYNIFQVHPARHYHFDAATRTLFLKTNDEEVKKLQEQLKEAKEKAEK